MAAINAEDVILKDLAKQGDRIKSLALGVGMCHLTGQREKCRETMAQLKLEASQIISSVEFIENTM
jgi:hypothetical protein